MTAINQNFTMYQGDSKTIIITVTQDDGSALDLAGASVKWSVKKRAAMPDHSIFKSTADGGITIVGSEIRIKLAPADTQAISGKYYHEGEITDQFGNVSTIFTGEVDIKPSGV